MAFFGQADADPSKNRVRLLLDVRKATKQGARGVAQRQRHRLTEMVAFARANSPYYRERYCNLPERVEDSALLPVTNKKELMARFDDWATDRGVTLEKVRAFVENPKLVGARFLGKYMVVTTSGTTGTPGLFVLDGRNLHVTQALAARMLSAWLSAGDFLGLVAGGGHMSMVMATGGHYASAVAAARLRTGRGARRIQVLSAQMPLHRLVAELNAFRPVVLAPYASTAALLASEQEAGRLHINLVLLALSAEGLPPSEYDRISKAFGAKVGNSYAASECTFLSYSCSHGWLHVNADWVLLEPVDADYRPVPLGEQSHSVLLSNLANRVQPILRYDLGDSVLQRPDPCPCGSPLPAVRVQGRAADVLTFSTERGGPVSVPPLAFGTLLARIPGVEVFQLVQRTPTSLCVRLLPAVGADPNRVWQAVHFEIACLLSKHKLDHVKVERAEEPPQQSPGGKYRTVIPLSKGEAS